MRLFGLEFAALWAVLIAFLNFVPYIGSVLGVVFPVLMTIVQFGDLGTILTMLLALTALQFAIGNFLDPYVMGNSLNLSPFAILISLAVWSELWGVPGRIPGSADHRDRDDRVLRVPGHAADRGAAVQERAAVTR